jgi:eukaryotic-like serine/threonine-protein kinase
VISQTLGPYQVLSKLGEGGMGEVYRARDTKLNRDVALKVLPEAFALDPERLARFKREAQVLASLNHPHIAAIYGFEDSSSTHALVLELVEGPTLADRIARGPIPLDEALPIAKQVADALEAAHEQGVVHRDLKPANIKLTPGGQVKVLDFGLAKALDPASGKHVDVTNSPTITTPAMTMMGVILGTAAYMSPEQARGGPADKRADLWAFGVVLYETLTGARAVEGATISDTLASILKTEPDWTRLPAETPSAIRRLLRRCLEKDRRRRLADAADARLDIEDAIASPADVAASSQGGRTVSARVAVPIGVACVIASGVVGAWLKPSTAPPARAAIARAALPLPTGIEIADGPSVAISPDGTKVAYVGNQSGIAQLYLRQMDGLEARAIGDTRGATAPFFSPDGQWIAFFSYGKLKKVSTTGGVVTTLADVASGLGGDWAPDDSVLFRTSQQAISTVSAAGGKVRELLTAEQLSSAPVRSFQILPGGETLLISSAPRTARNPQDNNLIEALTIKTGQRKTLVSGSTQARYLPTGHLVFLRNGTLMAAPLDLARLELSGTPVEVMSGVRQQQYTGLAAFSCSHVGTCVYVAGGTAASRTIAVVDRSGVARTLPLPPKSYTHPRFSPTGDRISWWLEQYRCDVEVYDMARGTVTRLASDADNHFPIWTPDGRRITSLAGRESRYEIVSWPVNGEGSEEVTPGTPSGLTPNTPLSWSPTGVLAFADRGDIWLVPRRGEGEPRPLETTRFTETAPAFSPDGRWLAYLSDESGRFEVYVRPFPGPGEKYLISTGGGGEPAWSRNGRELFFRNGEQLMVVDVRTTPAFSASRPRLLFTGAFTRRGIDAVNYDVSPDGQSFVMLNSGEDERAASQINVVFNWFDELKQRVPVK